MLDFPEDPRSSLSCAANHQSIGSGVVQYGSGFMRVSDISVSDNGYTYILFYKLNAVVLRFTIEQAVTRSAVNRDGLNSAAFGKLGYFNAVALLGSQPVRVFNVTGTSTALTTARRILPTSSGYCNSADPASLRLTFLAGQPMLISIS